MQARSHYKGWKRHSETAYRSVALWGLGFRTDPLQAVTKPLRVATESLRSRYGPLPNRYESLVILEPSRSKEPVPYKHQPELPHWQKRRHSLRSQPSSDGLAPWVVPSAPLPQGDSLWLAPSAHVCGTALQRRVCLGLRRSPFRPPTFLGIGEIPLHLPAEHRIPCTLLRGTEEAPFFTLARRKASLPGPTSWGYYSTIVLILQLLPLDHPGGLDALGGRGQMI